MSHRLYLSTDEGTDRSNENVLTKNEPDVLYYNMSNEDIDLKGYRCFNVGNATQDYDLVNVATVNEVLNLYKLPIITKENTYIRMKEALNLINYQLQFHKLTFQPDASYISIHRHQELAMRTIIPFEKGNDYFILNTFVYTKDDFLVNVNDPPITGSDKEQIFFAINYKNNVVLPDRLKNKIPANKMGVQFGCYLTTTFNPKQFEFLKWNNMPLIHRYEIQFAIQLRNN